MVNAITRQEQPQPMAAIEQVLVGGDLSPLTAIQRVQYYNRVCESVGLNPLTRPFDYLRLNNKLVLYARRDAADQLRSIHGISLSKPSIDYVDDLIIVTIEARDKTGRTDTDLGAVSLKGLAGEAKANAILKAITKAKRRVTLSLAGLGWLDETEVDSIPGAQRVAVDAETGEIVDGGPIASPSFTTPATNDSAPYYATVWARLTGRDYDFVNWIQGLHRRDEPCSDKQYQFLTGIVDGLTSNQHNYALSVLCQSEISSANKPSRMAAKALLRHLQEEIKTEDDVKVINPDYRQDFAAIVKSLAAQSQPVKEAA